MTAELSIQPQSPSEGKRKRRKRSDLWLKPNLIRPESQAFLRLAFYDVKVLIVLSLQCRPIRRPGFLRNGYLMTIYIAQVAGQTWQNTLKVPPVAYQSHVF